MKKQIAIFKKKVSCENYYKDSFKKKNFLESIKNFNFELEKYANEKLTKDYSLLFIDPLKDLCNKNECIQVSEKNDYFYKDSNHISNYGAKYIFDKNKNLIEEFLRN